MTVVETNILYTRLLKKLNNEGNTNKKIARLNGVSEERPTGNQPHQ